MIDLKTVLNSKTLSQLKFACQLLNISLQKDLKNHLNILKTTSKF